MDADDVVSVSFALLDGDAAPPVRATPGSSGWDLRARADTAIPSGGWSLVGTGVAVEIPRGFEGQVRSRSGLALKEGIFVLNSPGTIDSDYRGEVSVILANLSDEDYMVRKGDRVAQLVITGVTNVRFVQVNNLSETDRGAGGFGSSGKR